MTTTQFGSSLNLLFMSYLCLFNVFDKFTKRNTTGNRQRYKWYSPVASVTAVTGVNVVVLGTVVVVPRVVVVGATVVVAFVVVVAA